MTLERYNPRQSKIENAIVQTKKIILDISKDGPSKGFIGLPSYHLLGIAKNVDTSPMQLLSQCEIPSEEFIRLSQEFEKDVIKSESELLNNETDSFIQGRTVEIIARAIGRGELNTYEILADINPSWRAPIVNKVEDYNFNKIKFDGIKAKDLFKEH